MVSSSVRVIMGVAEQALAADQLKTVGFIMLSMLLGGVIGFERETVAKAPGIRTHMLIAGASTIVVMISFAVTGQIGDPSRSIHGVVTGIGFLCAGAIFQSKKGNVSGLTTAASMLYTAAIGCAVGAGYAITAVLSTLLAIVVLRVFGYIRYRLKHVDNGDQQEHETI